jgi:biotin synthase
MMLFRGLALDMLGVGPYLEAPGTPLAGRLGEELRHGAGADQVPADSATALKVVALARLACPDSNIPATTALETLDPGRGRLDALKRGANVVMPNLTPRAYRALYSIYPGKGGPTPERAVEEDVASIVAQIGTIGRSCL